jgi:hypothetical protein
MAKSPHTPEWRVLVAQEYLNGKGSSYDIADRADGSHIYTPAVKKS